MKTWKHFHTLCLMLVACSEETSDQRAEVPDSTGHSQPKTQSKATQATRRQEVRASNPEQSPKISSIEGVVRIRGLDGRNCQSILIEPGILLTPSHCANGTSLHVITQPALKLRENRRISFANTEIEDLLMMDVATDSIGSAVRIKLEGSALPALLPYPTDLRLVAINERGAKVEDTCRVLDFARPALLTYSCDPVPGQSGALLFDKDNNAFAIHLGIRGGFGYGVTLAAVASAMTSSVPLEAETP